MSFAKRIQSSTLIEVIVSMVIISLLSAIFFSFLSSLKRDQNIELKIKANHLLNNVSKNAYIEGFPDTSNLIEGNIKISVTKDSCKFANVECYYLKAFSKTNNYLAAKTIYIMKKP